MSLQRHQHSVSSPSPATRVLRPLPILLALSVAANLWFLLKWSPDPDAAEESGTRIEKTLESVLEQTERGEAAEPSALGDEGSSTASEAGPSTPPQTGGARFVQVTIEGPLSTGFVEQLGSPEGDRVGLTMSRLIVWDMDLRRDPRKGDVADVLYRLDDEGQPDILGLRYQSQKLNEQLAAWYHTPSGATFGSWYDSGGREVPGRLKGSPITDYEEVSSLLGDGRGHKGMDFKAPVGTSVYAPFAGKVTRTNWSFKSNGNCLELRSNDGTKALFLHLSSVASGLSPGDKVKKGQLIAKSGNTGRSSAPHLHYELRSKSGKTLDPLDLPASLRLAGLPPDGVPMSDFTFWGTSW